MTRAHTILGFAAAAVLCGAAGSSPVSAAFGNTIVSTYPDGRTAELWLAADGSYTGEGRRHDLTGGHWKLKGDSVCLRQSRPIPSLFSFCAPLPTGDLQTGWQGKAPTGEATRLKLVQGRAGGGRS